MPALVLVAGARPTWKSYLLGLPVIAAGEVLRLWAAAHVGAHSRGRAIRAPRPTTSGPYSLVRHPLYAGNAVICVGLLLAAPCRWAWFPWLFTLLFAVQYALFTRAEERLLAATWPGEWAAYSARTGAWLPRGGPGGSSLRPLATRDAWRREWPTLRTVLFMLTFLVGVLLLRAR